jgi:exonuclease VII large subunit
MITIDFQLQSQRRYITQLVNQLKSDYATLKEEMKQIAKDLPTSDEEFTFLEEFELLIVGISGYARQIESSGDVKQIEKAIAQLQRLQIFTNPIITAIYPNHSDQYPKILAYLQQLNYLRLLAIEYLQVQTTEQPLSA